MLTSTPALVSPVTLAPGPRDGAPGRLLGLPAGGRGLLRRWASDSARARIGVPAPCLACCSPRLPSEADPERQASLVYHRRGPGFRTPGGAGGGLGCRVPRRGLRGIPPRSGVSTRVPVLRALNLHAQPLPSLLSPPLGRPLPSS